MLVGAGGLKTLVHMISFSALMSGESDAEKLTTETIGSTPDSIADKALIPTGGESTTIIIDQNLPKKTFFSSLSFPRPSTPSVLTQTEESSSGKFSRPNTLPVEIVAGQSSHEGSTKLSFEVTNTQSERPVGLMSDTSLIGNTTISNSFSDSTVAEDARSMVYMGIDCVCEVFAVRSSLSRDFCHLFVKNGLLQHISEAFRKSFLLYKASASASPACCTIKNNGSGSVSSGHKHTAASANRKGHRRHISGSSDKSQLSQADAFGQSSTACSIEMKYMNCIANIYLKFSRTDATASTHLASNTEAMHSIMIVLQDPKLRSGLPILNTSGNYRINVIESKNSRESVSSIGRGSSSEQKRKLGLGLAARGICLRNPNSTSNTPTLALTLTLTLI
jgi:hypothetical protein